MCSLFMACAAFGTPLLSFFVAGATFGEPQVYSSGRDITSLHACLLTQTHTALEICNWQRMPCSSRASTNWGAVCCCLLNDFTGSSPTLSQVFLRMTPLPAVILSARPQNCCKLMAELMAGSFLSPCAVPCQKIGRAPPPVKLGPFCFGHPCSLEFAPNSRMQKLRKTVLATGANIEAEIRAPFLFHCHNAANILSRGLAF